MGVTVVLLTSTFLVLPWWTKQGNELEVQSSSIWTTSKKPADTGPFLFIFAGSSDFLTGSYLGQLCLQDDQLGSCPLCTSAAMGTNLSVTCQCLRNVGCHSCWRLPHQLLASSTATSTAEGCVVDAPQQKASLKHPQQSEPREEAREDKWGVGGAAWSIGRRVKGVGWWRCGGGEQQKYVCAANLMRTFERLNPKERAAAPQTAWAETGRALPAELLH